jgi:hypothetical protein
MVPLEFLHELLNLPEDALISGVEQTSGDHIRNVFSVHLVGYEDSKSLPTAGTGENAMFVTAESLRDIDSWWRR